MRQEFILPKFQKIRAQTELLCEPLAIEDYVIQSSEEVSPPKWHLAHTTWFFETFLLMKSHSGYKPFNQHFHYLFNSYYQSLGTPYPRAKRGLLARPTVEEVYAYRREVNEAMMNWLQNISDKQLEPYYFALMLGLNHEEQHQELLLMDVKHNLSIDPNFPAYKRKSHAPTSDGKLKSHWIETEGGVVDMGHRDDEFCFDNEMPSHQQYLAPYSLATQLITNGEYLEFIKAQGYDEPRWWLSDGWEYQQSHQWRAPLYWHEIDGEWFIFTLNGLVPLNLLEPVCHVSFYEADAFAKWRGMRLPTEGEWEHFVKANHITPEPHSMSDYHPTEAVGPNEREPQQFFGSLWQWTASPHAPYPGYQPLGGELGEYNGKFMANQMVLRGSSCVTPSLHARASYRNFFYPYQRWQFSGIRLACDSQRKK